MLFLKSSYVVCLEGSTSPLKQVSDIGNLQSALNLTRSSSRSYPTLFDAVQKLTRSIRRAQPENKHIKTLSLVRQGPVDQSPFILNRRLV